MKFFVCVLGLYDNEMRMQGCLLDGFVVFFVLYVLRRFMVKKTGAWPEFFCYTMVRGTTLWQKVFYVSFSYFCDETELQWFAGSS